MCPSGGTVYRHSNGEIYECQSSAQCPAGHECLKSVLQTGGEVRYCCPSQQHICKQQPDIGDDCGQSVLRYSFNSTSQQCQPLTFLGCGGNPNNFASMEVCYNFCFSAACAVSESVYISPSTGSAHDCSKTPCPLGYSCVPDSWNTTR
ncbi:Kunitz/Bovine pancreatic trypsin inhibitor domain protein, partial [Cooperia oncophora]